VLEVNFEKEGQQWESNPQPPHYECGALPIEAMLAIETPPSGAEEHNRQIGPLGVGLWGVKHSVKNP
jgi:hypothetical protein